ncbi:spore coat protein [Neobacillus notoginsengisoli]|uniref:Spore coat protein n=1 Tax=Neobacillus notoginsengisoli TaxID=1578198 RepID=A0A417YXZ9_9BACI|nr:spore coat protein [Neobacillus notoginsengisoli]RHW42584.1 spore coat protein [Neobacillus notoginsengisoli]
MNEERRTLAWHETLEMHELTAFQSIGLMKTKTGMRRVTDSQLREIYQRTIRDLEENLTELLQFYPSAPGQGGRDDDDFREDNAFYAGDLLAMSKSLVRNYGIAVTETATPQLRRTFTNHLTKAIRGHERIYNYMHSNGLYPSYDLGKLLQNDVNLARRAISMREE